jgi:hypothetical protein
MTVFMLTFFPGTKLNVWLEGRAGYRGSAAGGRVKETTELLLVDSPPLDWRGARPLILSATERPIK